MYMGNETESWIIVEYGWWMYGGLLYCSLYFCECLNILIINKTNKTWSLPPQSSESNKGKRQKYTKLLNTKPNSRGGNMSSENGRGLQWESLCQRGRSWVQLWRKAFWAKEIDWAVCTKCLFSLSPLSPAVATHHAQEKWWLPPQTHLSRSSL